MSHMGISEAIKNRKRSSKPSTVYSISSDDEAPIRSKPKKKLNRLSNVMPVAKKVRETDQNESESESEEVVAIEQLELNDEPVRVFF